MSQLQEDFLDAVYEGREHDARQILNRHGDLRLTTSAQLAIALATDEYKAAGILLKLGADINAPDEKGETVLMEAASFGETEKVRWLLDNGANPMVRGLKGKTARDYAEEWEYPIIAALLHAAEKTVRKNQAQAACNNGLDKSRQVFAKTIQLRKRI